MCVRAGLLPTDNAAIYLVLDLIWRAAENEPGRF